MEKTTESLTPCLLCVCKPERLAENLQQYGNTFSMFLLVINFQTGHFKTLNGNQVF
uniref:Uncharacterized protein n=1 Tax=Anguilla anguilla TaxID=7936 RepID=A0A0E9U4H7_ANGAN